MAGVNKVILIGNLGKDPEIRTTESGIKVANFSLATTESYRDRNTGERKDITDWHNIVLWRGLADIAERFLQKGNQVYIEGKLKTRSWEDKDGNTRYTTEVVGDNMTMLGGKNNDTDNTRPYSQSNESSSGNTGQSAPAAQPSPASSDTSDGGLDDLPF